MFKLTRHYKVNPPVGDFVTVRYFDRYLRMWRYVDDTAFLKVPPHENRRDYAQRIIDLDAEVYRRKAKITWLI